MKEIIVDGIPVLIKEKERPPRTIRIRMKKRGKKFLKDIPFSKLSPQHKQALENLAVMGFDKKKEAAVDAGFPEDHAIRTMNTLLVGRRELIEEIEEECQAVNKNGVRKKLAKVLISQLDAVHPLAKEDRTDNLAVLGAAKELNKIFDHYPAKKLDVREVGFHLHFTPADIEAGKQFKAITEADETT